MGQGSSCCGKQQAEYVPPLSVDDMVARAISLLAHPRWGPHLRQHIRTFRRAQYGSFDKQDLLALKDGVRLACGHPEVQLADVCAMGVALAILPLCADTDGWFTVMCDVARAEVVPVAAFYAALEQPACNAITNLTIKGDAFGTPVAAVRLGRCLSINSSIEALTIYDVDHFCDDKVWLAFSHALTSNATLRQLELSRCQKPKNSSHMGATLADSHKLSALQELTVGNWCLKMPLRLPQPPSLLDTEGWGTMLKHNSTIIKFKLELGFRLPQGGGLLVPVYEALLTNTTLQQLIITSGLDIDEELPRKFHFQEVPSNDAASLEDMLHTNQSLRYLNIISSGMVCNDLVVQGLLQNSMLEELHISVDAVGAKALMKIMAAIDGTLRLKSLCLGLHLGSSELSISQCFPIAVALRDMLHFNRTLTKLSLAYAPYSNEDWAIILPALVNNHTLKELDLSLCRGVDGGLVYDALLELLDSNTCITEIELISTPLYQAGKAQAIEALLEANREYGAALTNVPTVATTSCRLVLCGYPFAGKTTLMRTMLHAHPKVKQSFCKGQNNTPTNERTKGIDIEQLIFDDLTMWVWDFAGQREFHPLQDFIFPNASSVHAATAFVFTFNPIIVSNAGTMAGAPRLKRQHQFAQEFSCWLKFIHSNAKQRPVGMCQPLVLVVVTHKDKVVHMIDETKFYMMVEEWVGDTAQQFKDVISLEEGNLFFVNATNEDDFIQFEHHAIQMFRDRIREVRHVPIVCDDIARALGGSAAHQLEPIISFADFSELCESAVKASTKKGDKWQQEALRKLMSGTKGKAARVIAAYLRDAGEVLCFSDLDFLVRNPRWFAHGILGYLINIFPQHKFPATQNIEGISQSSLDSREVDSMLGDSLFGTALVSKKFLTKLLQQAIHIVGLNPGGTNTDQLILLMEKLDLCYKTGEKYHIPALLPDKDGKAERGECKREWFFDLPSSTSTCIFVSRRLQCSDRLRTFITPGFFPRLQVVLHRKANEWDNNTDTNYGKPKHPCELEKYFCRLRHNGMEILLEHSGSYDYFVDIMVKSYESQEDTELFLKAEIIDEIRRLCASPKGCQGVTLVEAIIRPDCVRESIMPCRHRQSILLADLKERMATIPKYKCYWEMVEDEDDRTLLPAAMHDPQRLLYGVPQEACDCYPDWNVKNGKKRGLAVIISMEKHNSGERSGGREDRENLKALAHSLDFEVHVMVDLTAEDVLQGLRTIAKEKILEEHESFLCFVNGHGDSTHGDSEEHFFKDQDDTMLLLDYIVKPFRECKQLQDKPKVFFVNSCRGSNKPLVDGQQCETSVQQQPPKEAIEYKYLREIKDCLIVFSTSGRSVSTRKPRVGTSFVLALRNAFTSKRQVLDVLGIVCCATNEVAAQEHKWKNEAGEVTTLGQCPVHVSSLTKLLYWR